MYGSAVYRKYFAATNVGNKFGPMRCYFWEAKDDALEMQKSGKGTWFVAEIKSHFIINGVENETVFIGGVAVTI